MANDIKAARFAQKIRATAGSPFGSFAYTRKTSITVAAKLRTKWPRPVRRLSNPTCNACQCDGLPRGSSGEESRRTNRSKQSHVAADTRAPRERQRRRAAKAFG